MISRACGYSHNGVLRGSRLTTSPAPGIIRAPPTRWTGPSGRVREQTVDVVRDPLHAGPQDRAGRSAGSSRLRRSASSTLISEGTGQDQVEVVAAAGQVAEGDELAVPEHADAGGTATDVDDHAVPDRSSAWAAVDLVDQVRRSRSRRVPARSGRPGARRGHTPGGRRSRPRQRDAQRALRGFLQRGRRGGRGEEVDDDPVAHRFLGRSRGTPAGRGVDHGEDDRGRAEVDADPQIPTELLCGQCADERLRRAGTALHAIEASEARVANRWRTLTRGPRATRSLRAD